MTSKERIGAPISRNHQEAEGGSAFEVYNSATIKDRRAASPTFSSVILRALENRPTNEDRIRGMA